MRGSIFYKLFTLFLFSSLLLAAAGQDIKNMRISVSSESLTVLKFNSRITRVEFGNRDATYTSQVRDDDNSLVIKTSGDTAVNTNLFITEGKRGHLFNVVYVPVIDLNNTKLYYDFSDLKKLKKLVNSADQDMAVDKTPERPDENAVAAAEAEKKARHVKDSTEAVEAQKRADVEMARQAKEKADSARTRQEENARLAKAKADAEAAQKAEEQRLTKAKADADAAQKREDQRLAKAKADAEAIQKAQEEKLAKAKAAAEAARQAEELRQIRAKSDSLVKAYSEHLMQARLDSIKRQKTRNDSIAKAKLDLIQMQKERNAELAKLRADSIQTAKETAVRIAKAKLDSIQTRKEEITRLAALRKKQIEDSLAAIPKVYTHVDLWRKYPKISFEDPPHNQHLAADYFLVNDTLDNAYISYAILKDSGTMQLPSNTDNNVQFTVENIIFKGVNCYMRIHIENKSKEDYLTGIINLRWNSDSGGYHNAYPCFITSYPPQGFMNRFPVLAPGTDITIVLTTRALNVKKEDKLLLTFGDRLYNTELEMYIPVEQYLSLMDHTK